MNRQKLFDAVLQCKKDGYDEETTKSIIFSKFGEKGLDDVEPFIKQVYDSDFSLSFGYEKHAKSIKMMRNIIILSTIIGVVAMILIYVFVVYLPNQPTEEDEKTSIEYMSCYNINSEKKIDSQYSNFISYIKDKSLI